MFMEAQNYKNLSQKILDFRKIGKIYKKQNCKSAKKILSFHRRENAESFIVAIFIFF